MPKFQVNLYIKDILITSYFVDANDQYDALDKGTELAQDDIYFDIEGIDD